MVSNEQTYKKERREDIETQVTQLLNKLLKKMLEGGE
jgi:hypothetical protein